MVKVAKKKIKRYIKQKKVIATHALSLPDWSLFICIAAVGGENYIISLLILQQKVTRGEETKRRRSPYKYE